MIGVHVRRCEDRSNGQPACPRLPAITRDIQIDGLADRARERIVEAHGSGTSPDLRQVVYDKVRDHRDVIIRTIGIQGLGKPRRIPFLCCCDNRGGSRTRHEDAVFRATPNAFIVVVNSLGAEAGGCTEFRRQVTSVVVADRLVNSSIHFGRYKCVDGDELAARAG